MEIVEIGANHEAYNKGYRVGIQCSRYEHLEYVATLYDFWLLQRFQDHMFDVHFTMDIKSNSILCFRSMEDLFMAKLVLGIPTRS